jgi:mannose-1-phosphate guanylyltransferase
VEAFIEKAQGPPPTRRINAGAYVIERDVVEARIAPGRPVSFEREVFPALVGDGLYGFDADGYWIDIGTPERYLEATYDLLSGRPRSSLPPRDETGSLIGPGCLTSGAHIGPQSVLGGHCSVGTDSSVERSVLHDRVVVGADCLVRDSVLAGGVRVGDGVRIEPGALLGSRVRVEPGAIVQPDARVEPNAVIEAGATRA